MSTFELTTLLGEARVRTRDGVVPEAMVHEMHERLSRLKTPLQAQTVVTLALLEVARGVLPRARELLESVFWLHPRALPADTLEFTIGWLVTDAAAVGDWSRVRWLVREAGRPEPIGTPPQVGVTKLAPDTDVLRFFEALAQRVLTAGPPGDDSSFRVRLPYEAVRFLEAFAPTAEVSPESAPSDPLGAALQALLCVNQRSPVVLLERAAALADEVLTSRPLRVTLLERATMLGGGDPDEALDTLRELFEGTLEAANPLPRGEAGGRLARLLRTARGRRRTALIQGLERDVDRLTDACEAGTAPPIPEVWREFVRIRRNFTLAVALSEPGDHDVPHLAIVRLVRYLGAWLRLTKKEPHFAHAVFQFLEVEALRAGDDKSARLARASCQLCLDSG